MADELVVASGDAKPPEQPERSPEQPAPLEERKEHRETTSAMWTRRIAVATLVLSIFVAGVTAWNAHQNIRSNERQAAENLAASERQADENFKREQQRDAYTEFLSACHQASSAAGVAARAVDRWFYGDKSFDLNALFNDMGAKMDSAFYARDILTFIAPGDTMTSAQEVIDRLDELDVAVARTVNFARDNVLQEADLDEMWRTRNELNLYEARQAFIELGRRDLDEYDG